MRLSISAPAARAAALAAVAARLFMGLMVDAPTTHNGAWLCALIGGLLAAPWFLGLSVLKRSHADRKALDCALLVATLLDAATVLDAVARSAGYLALDRLPSAALLIPAALAALWCVFRDGDAVGYGAMIWMRVAPALLAVVALLQRRYYRPEWLRPLLGAGWPAIVEGGVRAAGWIIPAASVLALSGGDGDAPLRSLETLAAAVGAAVLLIALRLMMTPTRLSGGAWLNRLDSLLCNGRAPLYLQLPLIAAWFAGLMHLLACECFAASALLQRLFRPLDGRVCALLAVFAALFISRLEALEGLGAALRGWGYVAVAGLTALSILIPNRQREA